MLSKMHRWDNASSKGWEYSEEGLLYVCPFLTLFIGPLVIPGTATL